jgi:hypothetical protein
LGDEGKFEKESPRENGCGLGQEVYEKTKLNIEKPCEGCEPSQG